MAWPLLDGVEAVLIDKDRRVQLTSGLKDSFQLTNEGVSSC